jgi:polysaccharide biosynthesis transport protein
MQQISQPNGDSERSLAIAHNPALPARNVLVEVPVGADEPSEWAHFAEMTQMLGRRKWLVLAATGVGLALGLAITLGTTPAYRAATSLEVQGLNEEFLDLGNIDPTAKPDTFSPDSYFQTQAEILQDEVVLGRVVDRLHLAQNPAFQEPLGIWARTVRFVKLPPALHLDAADRPIDILRKNLQITPSHHSRIIRVVYESPNPQLAADVVNTLADEFVNYNLEARLHAANQIGRWLGPQLQEMKDKLDRSEADLSNASDKAGLMLTSGTESVAEQQLSNLQRELDSAQADRIARESLYRMAVESPADSFPAALDTTTWRENQTKLTELRRQYAELSALYTDDNYRVTRVRAQIAELESVGQREAERIPKRAGNDYTAALTRELTLSKAYEAQAGLVSRQARERIRFETLKRAVDDNRQIYESTLLKVKEAGIASAIKPSHIHVVGPANAPDRPYSPSLPFNAGLGTSAGLCLGLLAAAALDCRKHVVRLPGELRLYVAAPELGVIPRASYEALYGAKRRQILDLHPAVRLELATWEEKHSPLSESFRNVLASVMYRDNCHAFLVTSPNSREGKTTVVSNLGIALAEIGKRVLMVDGDVRKPRLHEIFDQPNTWGLTNVLSEKDAVVDLPSGVLTRRTAIPGLSLLPSGPANGQVAELLHSPRMAALINHFRDEFDYIFVDAPPALQFADARVLARVVDKVVLVVRANRTDPAAVMETADRFESIGVSVLGTILNDWAGSPQDRYGYHYGYPVAAH